MLVDYTSGKVAKVEPITKGDDFTVAQAQIAAMAAAKISLKDAIDKAIGRAAGARAVGVIPSLKDGQPLASVLLFDGQQLKATQQSLE